ncbi:riboflavin synthase [Desulfofustis glycolicus]|uniref:Riboflavin synthase n=1 Tax=Desulfofustis glycolicus DSM 9705 TaxID=1121409 RepID=A0A1M5W2K3_9BACT|nr:riboflavin synthase [Desulfofustis glycolicus]MCB2215083.1 riboflavin synthase [Desulfobulbaceae bacterium]SHH81725.1 riboflavin synthase alpha chain [Desulfofustis glycolicus DSM 9705]
MFTGIIQGTGTIISRRSVGGGQSCEIETSFVFSDPEEGESVAVNGVCLTAYRIGSRRFTADVSPESLARTTLGELAVGRQVNLERALRLTDRLGGHLVSGHVDCVGRLASLQHQGDFTILSFSVPREVDRYIIEKGSVAVDGISLTVNDCSPGRFSVSIIPHTLQATTLGRLRNGGAVNIEVDIIGKYVEKLLGARHDPASGTAVINPAFLAEKGFY